MSPAKLVVNQLIEDLRSRPQDFTCGEYRLIDQRTKYEYWVTNGLPFYGVYSPYSLRFGFIQGWRFRKALRLWKAAMNVYRCRA